MTDTRQSGDSGLLELRPGPGIIAILAPLDTLAQSSPFEAEQQYVRGAVAKRQREFFAGRNLARLAMRRLSLPPVAMPRNPDGSPRWPPGMVGSITHNKKWIGVAVARPGQVAALGIDLETCGAVAADLRPILRTSEDCARLDDTLLFTAKEAIFKAVYPLCGEFLEFSDVSVSSTGKPGAFSAVGNSATRSSALIRRGTGQSIEVFGAQFSCFWIAANGSGPAEG